MENKIVQKRYAYYYESVMKLGKVELNVNPTIESLQLTRGVIQSAYKQMEKEFKVTIMGKGKLIISITDYLCYISTIYIAYMPRITRLKNLEKIVDIINIYKYFTEDVVNLLRLFHNYPDIVLKTLVNKNEYSSDEDMAVDMHKIVMILSSCWYRLFDKGVWVDGKMRDSVFDEDYSDELKIFNIIKKIIDG